MKSHTEPMSSSSAFERFSSLLIKDKRDTPFVFQVLRTVFILLPTALYIFLSDNVSYWVIIPYTALLVFFLGPQLLMLHNICHRNPWKKSVKRFADPLVGLTGLLYGLPIQIYFHHHIKMHHYEGNNKNDLSSTEMFKRNSFLAWLLYFARFVLLNAIELPYYFIKQKRYDFALKSFLGWISYYAYIYATYSYNPKGAIIVVLIPTAICWFGLMGGNWAQHAFIDAKDPENPYKNSITVIDSVYNKRCFNDGYHIGHHKFPGMHWTEMPQEFEKNIDEYYENGAMIFRALDYQAIWFLLMLKQYKFLAKYYVPKAGTEISLEEITGLIKERTSAII
jgi:fatty acid desaturase